MSDNDYTYLINSTSSELIPLIEGEFCCDRLTAIDKLFNSSIYEKLLNPETGLYYQSTFYIFELLKEEFHQQDS